MGVSAHVHEKLNPQNGEDGLYTKTEPLKISCYMVLTVLTVYIRQPAAPWEHERRERHHIQDQQCRELAACHT